MSSASDIRLEIKTIIVQAANLQNIEPAAIEDEGPLFGRGLGLDSLDALQLAMSLEERYGVRVPEGDEGRAIFASVRAIADYVAANRASGGTAS